MVPVCKIANQRENQLLLFSVDVETRQNAIINYDWKMDELQEVQVHSKTFKKKPDWFLTLAFSVYLSICRHLNCDSR